MEPIPGAQGSFRYSRGSLYEANEHALRPDGTALLVIDEINRGPAVEAFGDAVVTLEADKRLEEDNQVSAQSFPVMLPDDDGSMVEYYFSAHLYLLAAMNSADASVAPMDVAFLRRWQPVELLPDVEVARNALGLNQANDSDESSKVLLRAFLDAWQHVNNRISLLRGIEYQLGHAAVMPEPGRDLSSDSLVVSFVSERWSQLEQHVRELFFGDPRAEVAVMGESADVGYRVEEQYLGSELGTRVVRPQPTTMDEWIDTLGAVVNIAD